MTIRIDPKLLASALSTLKAVPDKANKIPIAQLYLFEPAAGGIMVRATDMDMETALRLDCQADFAPVCLQPYLVETGSRLAAETVEFSFGEKEATVKAGRARYKAQLMPGADFPRLDPEFGSVVEIAGNALATLVDASVDATAAPGGTRYYLEGIFVETADGRLHATATDGNRLQHASIAVPATVRLAEGIIVPTKAARQIADLGRRAGGNAIRLHIGATGIRAEAEREAFTSKLVEGTYPNWRRVVPELSGNAATVDLAEMVAALDRVSKVMNAAQLGDKDEVAGYGVRLAADGEWLTISSRFAEAADAVRAEFQGEFPALGVSVRFLHATLSDMRDRGAETVTLDAANGDGAPIRLDSPTDEDFVAIVMPMRVWSA